MAKTVIGLFDELSEAQRVVDDLHSQSFTASQVTLIGDASDASSLSMLDTAGIPAEDVRFYTEGVRQGGALVMVRVDDNAAAQTAVATMDRYNMVDIDTRVGQLQQSGKSDLRVSTLDTEGTVIPIMEEEIQIGKRQVQRGGVRVHTTMTERPVEEQVTLRDETVNVERRPVNRELTQAEMTDAFQERSIEMTETDEEAVVAKTARIVEEVVVGKQVTDRTETVRDSVRRTDVQVENLTGETTVTSGSTTGMRDFASYDQDFRSYYQSNYAKSGYTYDQYAPVFRYGHDLAGDSRYSGEWSTVEGDARTQWEAKNPGTWEQFKDAIRYSWNQARGTR